MVGMWTFMASEIMFFGVLFVSYFLFRWQFADSFRVAGREMNFGIGTINTGILLTSSLTMAMAVEYGKRQKYNAQIWALLVTASLGAVFVGLKVYEWYDHASKGFLPGANFQWTNPAGDPVHAEVFFWLYYALTGVHALHLTIGIGVVIAFAFSIRAKDRHFFGNYTPVEMAGIYWHYVDLIWIFLYPLFYLIPKVGAHG